MPKIDSKKLLQQAKSTEAELTKKAKQRDEHLRILLNTEEELKSIQKKHDDAVRQIMIDRTSSFNPDVVSQAKDLGINPDNFESEEEVYNAVGQLKKSSSIS